MKPRHFLIASVILLIPASLIVMRGIIGRRPGATDFHENQSRYESVVKTIRGHDIPRGRMKSYLLETEGEDVRLKERSDSGTTPMHGANVWAAVSDSGALSVAIETVNNGHAGEFGYLYSEEPVYRTNGIWPTIEGPGREWTIEDQVDDNWWHVSCRLN